MKMNLNDIKTYSAKYKKYTMIKNFTRGSVVAMFMSLSLIMLSAQELGAQCETINLACNDLINVSINEDCYASINADLILEDPPLNIYPDDGMNYNIVLIDEAGYPIVPSNQVGEEHVGMTIKASITLVPCNISCWGYIYVEDKIGPKFWNCVDGSLPTIDIDCEDFSNGYVIPDPLLGGVCETIDELSFEDDTTTLSCVNEFAVTISRLWTASDLAGNTTQCAQQINIRKFDLIDLEMPDDFIVTIDPDEDCDASQDVSPERTGYPTGIYCPNIMYFYSDIDYPQCGRQIKLLRNWSVMDWCTGQIVTDGQIIKIIDDSAPRVMCQLDTLMVAKENYSCEANAILNPLRVMGYDTLGAVTLLDTCPEEVIVEVGFLEAIPFQDQPLNSPYYNIAANEDGVYELPPFEEGAWVRYCFSDACGNETDIPDDVSLADSIGYCCYFYLEAKDLSAPTPICEGFTKVPLGAGGLTEVPAESFDDNSFDPCDGVSHFEVRREGSSCPGFNENGNLGWGESIHFCCEDLGDTITIRLRVFDFSGNFSECLGLVCVTNPSTPQVQCPEPYVELECGDNYRDYNLIGYPQGIDGCDAGIDVVDESFDLTGFDISCGTGTIRRRLVIEDAQGNLIKICEQEIVYDDMVSTPLLPGDFEFPDDITIDVCDSGGSLDPVFTGIPYTDKEFGCANIAITYEDSTPHTQNSNGVCYTILREWQVVDWCNFHPSNPTQHILKSTQEIRVINTAVPQFDCPQDITLTTTEYECEAYVELHTSVSTNCPSNFDVEWTIDANADGTPDFSGFGTTASGTYPVGVHSITFTGRNYCGGNSASCTYLFTIEGTKPPVAICLAELTWSVGSGTTEVWASDFDFKSEGGCGLDELSFSFVDPFDPNYPQSSQVFDCSDIPNGIAADIPVEVFVIDEEGRYASCLSTLQLQDTGDACVNTSNGNIVGGQIQTEMSQPITEVMVELIDMHSEDYMMEMTSDLGEFAFSGVLSENDYQLRPSFNKDHLDGVSTLDLLLIQRHILGLSQLEGPYKRIAADVDHSGSITAIDLIHLRKLILGMYESFPESDSWTFVPSAHKFIDDTNPWNYPDYLDISQMKSDEWHADFIAVKMGDVDNSGVYNKSVRSRSDNTILISTENASYQKGELVAVPMIIEDDLALRGMQFTLEFDESALLFQGVDGASMNIGQENFALLNDFPGVLTFSVGSPESVQMNASDLLFTIYFEATRDLDMDQVIDMTSLVTKAELYDEDFNIMELDFILKDKASEGQMDLVLYQNEPNPFNFNTSIGFYNPERQHILLEIMDANGRLILKKEKEFDKGVNKFEVLSSDLDASGLLLYRISSGQTSITRKMIMVK